MDKFDKWQYERMKSYEKGEELSNADKRFEKWLINQQIKENIKENTSLYRRRK